MHPPETPVGQLKNIGPLTEGWLREIGICTRGELERIGAAMAYKICQHQRTGVNRLLLYALQGALEDRHYASFTPDEKARLTAEANGPFAVRYEA